MFHGWPVSRALRGLCPGLVVVLAAVAVPAAATEQTQCGVLVQGVECTLFQTDDGALYLLSNSGQFTVGTSVCVTGTPNPDCATICMQGNGCFDVATIKSRSTTTTAHCTGDCNADGAVTCDEIVRCVGVILRTITPGDNCCPATVDELLVAVNNALAGCPP